MTSLATLIYLPRSVSLFANGVFCGLGFSASFVSVPAIKASKDPLPSFVTTYNNGAKIAIATILISTVANAICYTKTNEQRFLYSTALSFFSFPFTLIFIKPVNNQLFALQKLGDDYDRQKVHQLVTLWSKLQAVRTIAGTAAFLVNILYKV